MEEQIQKLSDRMCDHSSEPVHVYLNRIETAVPPTDVHEFFLKEFSQFIRNERERRLFDKLASKCQIEHRYTVMKLAETTRASSSHQNTPLSYDSDGLFRPGAFASTAKRMQKYKEEAFSLAEGPVSQLLSRIDPSEITHLIVTSCTGFYAPGLDLELQKRFNLRPDLERSVIGFMGCYAAFNAMKLAWHVIRSKPKAKVLIVNLELCTLHLREDGDIETMLGFLQFADGCAASIMSAERFGLRVDRFHTDVFPADDELIQWHVGDQGFEMHLSTQVPIALGRNLALAMEKLVGESERSSIQHWAIHPGGRSILDAVQNKAGLTDDDMQASREVLRDYGNMSSATVMFVLKKIMEERAQPGPGIAMAFGPGLTLESAIFHKELQ